MVKRKNESETTEEVSFPRGGASTLTPLEHREISNQVAKDLFTAKKSTANTTTTTTKENAKKKRKVFNKKDKSSSAKKITTTEKKPVKHKKIEELTFKKLSIGSLVLGCIVQINELNIVVGLPNQLVGVVPITEVSEQLSTLVEAAADEDEDEEIELPNNKDIFYIGQWVQCRVTAVEGDDGSTKKRVDLSLKPSTVNSSIAKMDVTAGLVLGASVDSVEDHGYVLSLGINGLTGFCHHKDAKSYIETYNRGEQLIVGQYVQCLVKDMAKNKRTVNLTLDREAISSTQIEAPFSTLNSITPGQLVNGIVQHSSSRGLSIKLMGLYDAMIDRAQLPFTKDVEKTYTIGTNLTFRTLFTDITTENKQFYGTVIPHCCSLSNPVVNKKSTGKYIGDLYPYGKFLEKVTVVRVTHAGVFVSIENLDNIMGFIHISRLSDERVAAIQQTSGPYSIGTTHRARVLSYSPVDGVLSLTIQPSVLKEQYLQYSDIVTGKMVNGTIIRFAQNGVLVKLSDRINGYIPTHHLSDAKLSRPELKFKAGDKVRARVLLVNEEQRKVVLTLKKSLIDSNLPLIKSIADAKPKMATHGIIVSVQPKGSVIGFYNNVTGFCPGSEMTEVSKNVNLKDAFHVGQTVKVYVLDADLESKKLMLSMIRDEPLTDAQREAAAAAKKNKSKQSVENNNYSIGDMVNDVKVTNVKETQLIVKLPNGSTGHVDITEAFDNYESIPVENLNNSLVLFKNKSVNLKVLGIRDVKKHTYLPISNTKNPKQRIECSLKSDEAANPISITSIHPGNQLLGFVIGIEDDYLKIAITPFIRGILHKKLLKNMSPLSKHFSVGQAMLVQVKSVNENKNTLSLSPVHSNEEEKNAPGNISSSNFKSIKVGQKLNGTIKKIDERTGLSVELLPNIIGRVALTELSDEFQPNPTKSFKLNQDVECKVIHVNYKKHHLDLSLCQSDLKSSKDKQEGQQQQRIIKSHDDIQKGDVLKGYIINISSAGVFIAYHRDVHSRVKISQLSDSYVKDWQSLYSVGQLVDTKILSVDSENKRIEASLKESAILGIKPPKKNKKKQDAKKEEQIPDYDESEDEEMEQDNDEDDDDEEMEENEDTDDEEEDESDQDSDVDMIDANGVEDDDDESSADEDEEKEVENLPALKVGGKFDWSGQTTNLQLGNVSSVDSESEDDDSEDTEQKKKSNKNKKKQQVEDKTAELNSEAPQSVNDFERLLVGSPDSSYLWINYMAYQLQLSEIEKARAIGERALKTINFREEQEKMNVWVALLNLENQFGSDESIEQVFKRALTFCEPKKVYLHLLKIYEKSEKLDKAESLWKEALKKFSQSSEIWTLFGEFYLKQDNIESARELLQRSLQSLPKHKHIKTIVKFAQLEFKFGEAERGRTILEGVMSSSPKRVDLWNIYLDLEIKNGDHEMVQRLFERVVSMKFSSKKMKFLFKKWLQYEKDHGSADDVEHVKEKTLAYVSSL